MTSLKSVEKKTKQVFKPFLDDPYPQSNFPIIDNEVQQQILAFLLVSLKDLGSHNKLKKESKDKEQFKSLKPEILKHVTLGFNSTVTELERQVKSKKPIDDPILYVFVCKSDISPPLLIQQFPNLCYMAGGQSHEVKLIQLPRGSVDKFEQEIGQKINIIGLRPSGQSISKSFLDLLKDDSKVPILQIEWLKTVRFHKTNVNMVKVTAPVINKSKIKPAKVEKVAKPVKKVTKKD